jgi:hypothetical protein
MGGSSPREEAATRRPARPVVPACLRRLRCRSLGDQRPGIDIFLGQNLRRINNFTLFI